MSNYLIPMEELIANYYNPNDLDSIVKYAKQMERNVLRSFLLGDEVELLNENKGDFGNLLEAIYFKVKNNNESRPDIPESKVEIKTGQVWSKKERGTKIPSDVIKERLKISMIDYMKGFEAESLTSSSLWTKLENILLLLFHRDTSPIRIDQTCVYSGLLNWDEAEILQMSQDWLYIKNKVNSGEANNLSEGDTWYLGACTAGANAKSTTPAPKGVSAKVRAFSLKNSYLNYKLGFRPKVKGPKIIMSPDNGQTLDSYIISNMNVFFDKPLNEIALMIRRPELSETNAKNKTSNIARMLARMLLEEIVGKPTVNVTTNFEQFSKAGVIEKTVTLEKTGSLEQSVSFPAIKWTALVEEDEWENSDLYERVTSKFFFTVFKKTSSNYPIYVGCFFWTMPDEDINEMQRIWNDTKEKVKKGLYSNFMGLADSQVGHVRPHGRTKDDTYPTPEGGQEGKKSFWLNSRYIKQQINKKLNL